MPDMLAGRLDVATGSFAVTTVPIPEPGHGQVRVKVAADGVCLSDLHFDPGHARPALLFGWTVILGHEVAGTVDALGPGVGQIRIGQRVLLVAGQVGPDLVTVLTRGVDHDGGWALFALAEASTVIPTADRRRGARRRGRSERRRSDPSAPWAIPAPLRPGAAFTRAALPRATGPSPACARSRGSRR
jgi:NADPH:quinone reductase-like Zn-dependent oxidoreductase